MSDDLAIRSVYIHAPFCARRCSYCDFAVSVDAGPDPARWHRAIGAEWSQLLAGGGTRPVEPLRTLYVGGGTPSLLGPGAMAGLVAALGRGFVEDPELEWTAEANPESFLPEVAEAWRSAGVNRISLGMQTFNPEVLRWMGRMHGPDGADRAVQVARAAGLESISVDLIFGLPERLERDLAHDLDRLLALDTPHVSIYGLTIEEGTPLGRAVREGRETPVDEARYAEEYLTICERMAAAGYHHYEVSNFARPGWESAHNRIYWRGDPYLGLGNGAHSYRDGVRSWNIRDWAEYSTAVIGGARASAGEEPIGPRERQLEEVWLSLRTSDGLSLAALSERGRGVAAGWTRRGYAETGDGMLRLTARGWLLLDQLAVELDRALGDADSGPADS